MRSSKTEDYKKDYLIEEIIDKEIEKPSSSTKIIYNKIEKSVIKENKKSQDIFIDKKLKKLESIIKKEKILIKEEKILIKEENIIKEKNILREEKPLNSIISNITKNKKNINIFKDKKLAKKKKAKNKIKKEEKYLNK